MFGVKMRTKEDVRIAEVVTAELLDVFEEERDSIREDARREIVAIQK